MHAGSHSPDSGKHGKGILKQVELYPLFDLELLSVPVELVVVVNAKAFKAIQRDGANACRPVCGWYYTDRFRRATTTIV